MQRETQQSRERRRGRIRSINQPNLRLFTRSVFHLHLSPSLSLKVHFLFVVFTFARRVKRAKSRTRDEENKRAKKKFETCSSSRVEETEIRVLISLTSVCKSCFSSSACCRSVPVRRMNFLLNAVPSSLYSRYDCIEEEREENKRRTKRSVSFK